MYIFLYLFLTDLSFFGHIIMWLNSTNIWFLNSTLRALQVGTDVSSLVSGSQEGLSEPEKPDAATCVQTEKGL